MEERSFYAPPPRLRPSSLFAFYVPRSSSTRNRRPLIGKRPRVAKCRSMSLRSSGTCRGSLLRAIRRTLTFLLGPADSYSANGGLLSTTNLALVSYIGFAYKLTGNQTQSLGSELPKSIRGDRFDIQAHAPANTTKDQMRLMMQSLLADRFKLVVHTEKRQLPIFALVLEKPGKTGPQLRPTQTIHLAPPLAWHPRQDLLTAPHRPAGCFSHCWTPLARTECAERNSKLDCGIVAIRGNGGFRPRCRGSDRSQWKF